VTCKTGKVKEDAECGGSMSCKRGVINLKKGTEFNSQGIATRTHEESSYDYKVYWDGEYNWECRGYNGGATTQCALPNDKRPAYCGDYNGKSLEKLIGYSSYGLLVNMTNRPFEFNSTSCPANVPAGIECVNLEYDPSKLCVIPAGYGRDPQKIVTVIDKEGTDGEFNWKCSAIDGR
jgi:hypothetical protein